MSFTNIDIAARSIDYFYKQKFMNYLRITFRKANVIYRLQRDPAAQKLVVARLVASGVVHQWFGNIVSPFWWSYLWLNDGIATLFGTDAVDKVS